MNKLKKMPWLVVAFVGLFLTYGAIANEHYDDWEINDSEFPPSFILTRNEHSEEMVITCTSSMYLAAFYLPDYKTDGKSGQEVFFDYQVNNQNVILKGKKYHQTGLVSAVLFPDNENGLSGEIDKYQTLFQQMLQAKKSLTVNLIDADGHIYRSASFSAKGLPEALIEFAKQCGTDFQTYSGIKVNLEGRNN